MRILDAGLDSRSAKRTDVLLRDRLLVYCIININCVRQQSRTLAANNRNWILPSLPTFCSVRSVSVIPGWRCTFLIADSWKSRRKCLSVRLVVGAVGSRSPSFVCWLTMELLLLLLLPAALVQGCCAGAASRLSSTGLMRDAAGPPAVQLMRRRRLQQQQQQQQRRRQVDKGGLPAALTIDRKRLDAVGVAHWPLTTVVVFFFLSAFYMLAKNRITEFIEWERESDTTGYSEVELGVSYKNILYIQPSAL